MQHQKKKIKGSSTWVVFILLLIIAGLLFFGDFFKTETGKSISIDGDNNEIVVEEKDIDEIEKRLDELDIDLDDIIHELNL